MKRREARDAVRKELGEKEGVNWKRIVLMSKLIAGFEPKYVIKKSK